MGVLDRFRGRAPIRVHLLIRGRIGPSWLDVDEHLDFAAGATVADLFAVCDRRHLPLRQALADSPHLSDSAMLNGERVHLLEATDRPLQNGDQLYLLGPLMGG